MSLLDKLKSEAKRVKADSESRRGGFDDVRFFKPITGDNMIRILPHWNPKKRATDELFFVKRVIHYLPQKKRDGTGKYNAPFPCLSEVEEECPACVAFDALKKLKDKTASEIKTSERYLYNIIDYGKDAGPEFVVYPCPFMVHTDLMDWTEEINSEFWDVKKGRDWKLKKTVDKSKGDAFGTKYKLMPKGTDTPIPAKLLAEMDGKMVDLDTVWADHDRQKMLDALALLGLDPDILGEEEPVPKAKAKAKKPVDDDEEEEAEDDEDDFVAKKKTEVTVKSAKAKVKVEVEEEEEEEEEEPVVKKKAKPPLRKAPEPEPEEEEEEPVVKKKAKPKAKPVDDEIEEDDTDEALEAEIKRLGV